MIVKVTVEFSSVSVKAFVIIRLHLLIVIRDVFFLIMNGHDRTSKTKRVTLIHLISLDAKFKS